MLTYLRSADGALEFWARINPGSGCFRFSDSLEGGSAILVVSLVVSCPIAVEINMQSSEMLALAVHLGTCPLLLVPLPVQLCSISDWAEIGEDGLAPVKEFCRHGCC